MAPWGQNLEEKLQHLYTRNSRSKVFQLERVRNFFDRLNIQQKGNFIHVGGTNGKGSVCAFLSGGFQAFGKKVGLYTSPHLVRINERFQINRTPISDKELESLLDEIQPIVDELSSYDDNSYLSCFEILTAIGLLYFQRHKVDIAIIEVGLGGRLDATNVLTPEISVITTVGMDHEEFLGETLEAIAAEKAGILKPEIPVAIGETPSNARAIIEARAHTLHCPIITQKTFSPTTLHSHFLKGTEQASNLALVEAIGRYYVQKHHLENEWERFREGVANATWNCRWQTIIRNGQEIILDSTHNACGKPFLEKNIQDWIQNHLKLQGHHPRVFCLLTGMLGERRAAALLPMIQEYAQEITLVKLHEPRGLSLECYQKYLTNFSGKIHWIDELEIPQFFDQKLNPKKPTPILVTGSIHLVGAALKALEEKDRNNSNPSC